MKKIVALLLAVLMVGLNCVASAETVFQEPFTIRNGIKAGMSAEEVKETEIKNGNEQYYDEGISSLFGEEFEFAFLTNVAGNSTVLFYWFDENDSVKDIQYGLLAASAYDSLEKNLIEKYGQPFVANTQLPFETRIMTFYDHIRVMNPVVKNYESWILWYDDCCVVVELLKLYTSKAGYAPVLNYSLVSHEEVEKVLAGIERSVEAAEQSAINDL